jgi:hypothetical protein
LTQTRHWTEWLLILIAVITVLSGIGQLLLPDAALALMNITPLPETRYLFRLVSLLTALFGGALLHTAFPGQYQSTVLLWAGLQKLLGAAAVLLAVLNGLIAAPTLLIAAYDALAGLTILWFYNRRKSA